MSSAKNNMAMFFRLSDKETRQVTNMRKTSIPAIIIGFLILFQLSAGAHTFIFPNNKTFHKLDIIPSNPTEEDEIRLVIYMNNRRPNSLYFNSQWNMEGYQIEIQANYHAYPPGNDFRALPKKEVISLGKLPAGTYTVKLIRRETVHIPTVEPPHNLSVRSMDTVTAPLVVGVPPVLPAR
ncbi:MAG: hypothetical protein Kow0037_27220 [Calditrichia bacterium]